MKYLITLRRLSQIKYNENVYVEQCYEIITSFNECIYQFVGIINVNVVMLCLVSSWLYRDITMFIIFRKFVQKTARCQVTLSRNLSMVFHVFHILIYYISEVNDHNFFIHMYIIQYDMYFLKLEPCFITKTFRYE